jgi:hypothetical protein
VLCQDHDLVVGVEAMSSITPAPSRLRHGPMGPCLSRVGGGDARHFSSPIIPMFKPWECPRLLQRDSPSQLSHGPSHKAGQAREMSRISLAPTTKPWEHPGLGHKVGPPRPTHGPNPWLGHRDGQARALSHTAPAPMTKPWACPQLG